MTAIGPSTLTRERVETLYAKAKANDDVWVALDCQGWLFFCKDDAGTVERICDAINKQDQGIR